VNAQEKAQWRMQLMVARGAQADTPDYKQLMKELE
jgi:hypothetical protein